MANNGFDEYLKQRAALIDAKIGEYLKKESSDRYVEKLLGRAGYKYHLEALNKSILEPSWYLLNLGGKRWRPVLMLLIIEALGKDPDYFLEFAMVPEIIHNATLVHDDIEDGSETRRGAPSVYIKYGLDVATNLGDFLFYFPVVALLDSKKLSMETKNKFLSIYAREMLRVTTGQATDIAWHNFSVDPLTVTEENYLQMVYDKTGVLARMAGKLAGVLCEADDETVDALGQFGATIGVAFQLQDDVLNIYASGVAASKGGVGEDITEGKITLLVIRAMQKATQKDKERLLEILRMHTKDKELIKEAISIIDRYDSKTYVVGMQKKIVTDSWNRIDKILPESDAKKRIKELADFLIKRSV